MSSPQNLNAEGNQSAATNDASTAHLKIFVGGLKPMTDSEALKTHFQVFGTVLDAVVMTKKDEWSQTLKSRGFGFVTFESKESVDLALKDKNYIDDREVDVKRADSTHKATDQKDKAASGKTDKIFVGGLNQDTTGEQLEEYFKQFGDIVDAVVMKDRTTDRSRGFGFVRFCEDESVKKCMEHEVDGKPAEHEINGKFGEVKPAVPQEAKGKGKGGKGGKGKGGYGEYGGKGYGRGWGEESYGKD